MTDEIIPVLGHMREFPAIATADILAPSAQPNRFVLEVCLLGLAQVTAVQVVLPPPIVMVVFGESAISESQTRLRPPDIPLRPVDLVEEEAKSYSNFTSTIYDPKSSKKGAHSS